MNGRPLYNYNVRADLGVGQPLCLKTIPHPDALQQTDGTLF